MFVRRMLAALAVLVLVATGASANGLPEELKARRERLMQSLGADTIAVLWSAPERNYSRSVDYEYRQDSDLLYLTGRDAARDDPGADAGEPHAARDPVHPAGRRTAGALGGAPAHRRRGDRADGDCTRCTRRPRSTASSPTIMEGAPYGLKSREAVLTDTEHTAFFAALEAGNAKVALRLPSAPAARGRARARSGSSRGRPAIGF